MKPSHSSTKTHFAIGDSRRVAAETKGIKKILDAKYEKANLNKLVKNLEYLNNNKQDKLLKLLKSMNQCSMEP